MRTLAWLLLVLAAGLTVALAAVVVPWFVVAWRELGEHEPKHRHRPQIPRLDPWEPPTLPEADSTRVDLPAIPCLQEAWVRETLAMIEERSA